MIAALLAAGFAFVEPECSAAGPSFHVGDEENCPLMRKNVLGAKVIGIASIPIGEPQDVEPQAGIGLLYERTLVAMRLAAEFSVHVVSTPLGPHLPVDFLLKKPFHISHRFEPYLGLGGVVSIALGRERFVAAGAIGSAGLYFWFREGFGLLLEADYAVLREPGQWRQEIEGTTGPVIRF